MLHGVLYRVVVPAYNAGGVMVVMADPCFWGSLMVNPGFRGQCGGSYACAWMTSRVVFVGVLDRQPTKGSTRSR
jgi:hypothetical protein